MWPILIKKIKKNELLNKKIKFSTKNVYEKHNNKEIFISHRLVQVPVAVNAIHIICT